MRRRIEMTFGVLLCFSLFLAVVTVAHAVTLIAVPATVDDINVKAKTMSVTYTDPDTQKAKQQKAYWDKSTEFIEMGPPPDMKESPAKPEDIKKGAKVQIVIEEKPAKDGKHRLDTVRIKP